MTDDETDIAELLRRHVQTLRQQLGNASGLEEEPDDGSDATLLIESLAGLPSDVSVQRFEESGRALAHQGGRLEM
ncbi:MAG TPA: hypothetical protein VJO13_03095, partial [Ktedonobacterales bacterium]|nr:hypothetical protein [Ktedonobacterales bacterium]